VQLFQPVSENDERDDLIAVGDESAREGSAFSAPRIVAILFVALVPFWLVPVSHVLSNPETATGFFHYELPYYVANGRSAFERGNGIFYPNPYDPSAAAPSIYAHWLPWIFGAFTAVLGFDPGDVILLFTFVASIIFAWATRELVLYRIKSPASGDAAFLLAMWGGGLLAIVGTGFCIASGTTWFDSVLRFDPGNGLWFLNWGRNSLFPTEAVYHTLAVLCWLSEIRDKKIAANMWLVLLATTHPWSGLELLLTINLWRGIQFLQRRDRSSLQSLVFSCLALLVFLGYYKVWLPTFPQHAELQSVWELNWSVASTSALLAYLPMLIPAAILVRRRFKLQSLDRTEQFLLCALCVATGLAFHDRLIKPVQPIHFTRGYVWMPLFLLALPLLVDWWNKAWMRRGGLTLVAVFIAAMLVADNAVFSIVHWHRQSIRAEGFYMDRHERSLCLALHQSPRTATKTILSDSEALNYLLPAYANVRPWLGHHFNTPAWPKRNEIREACFEGHTVHPQLVPNDVDLLVVRRTSDVTALQNNSGWKPLELHNAEWQAWERASAIADVSVLNRSDAH
jgi:hypothetical protein